MAHIFLPVPLRKLAEGQASFESHGGTVHAALRELVDRHPALASAILDRQGRLTRFVGVFVNGEDYRLQGGESRELTADDRLDLLLPIAGG